MFEEILRELLGLSHVLFQIFFVQVLLHDPVLVCISCPSESYAVLWLDSIFRWRSAFLGQPDALVVVLEEAKDQ